MNDVCLGCLARKSTGMPQLASVSQLFLESAPSSGRLLILDLLQQRAGKGHGNVFSQMYACLDPRATNHAYRCIMAEESNCTTQYRMNAHINTTRPMSIIDNPECRWLGIEIRSVTRSTKRPSFPVLGLTLIPSTMQYAWHAWMQLIYNLACTMLLNGIHDARGNKANTMR